MRYPSLTQGILLKRYKRFFVDVQLPNGLTVTAHCANTGSMRGCLEIGAKVALSPSKNPLRKLAYTLEMIRIGKVWVGVNTHLTNALAEEMLIETDLLGLGKCHSIQREVKFSEHTRFDFFIQKNQEKIFLEVKNVSMVFKHHASFPDAISTRGLKHLEELENAISQGYRAIIVYVCQRDDAHTFGPAFDIDPEYARGFLQAQASGVEIFALKSKVSIKENKIYCKIPINITNQKI